MTGLLYKQKKTLAKYGNSVNKGGILYGGMDYSPIDLGSAEDYIPSSDDENQYSNLEFVSSDNSTNDEDSDNDNDTDNDTETYDEPINIIPSHPMYNPSSWNVPEDFDPTRELTEEEEYYNKKYDTYANEKIRFGETPISRDQWVNRYGRKAYNNKIAMAATYKRRLQRDFATSGDIDSDKLEEINFEDTLTETSEEEPEYTFKVPGRKSISLENTESSSIHKPQKKQKKLKDINIGDIPEDAFISDLGVYHRNIPDRKILELGDTSTSSLVEYDEIPNDIDYYYNMPSVADYTTGEASNLTLEHYGPDTHDQDIVYDDYGRRYEFNTPHTLSLTEGVTIGDKLKPADYIRPITYNEAITIGNIPEEDKTERGKISNIFEERRGYSNEVQDEINLLSIDKNNTEIIGSATYAVSSRYASDLDFFEKVDVCCSKDDAVHVFLTGIQQIVKNVLMAKYHWFIEVKVGLDERYPEHVGHMRKGIYIMDDDFKIIVNDLILKNLLNKEEADIINNISNMKTPKQTEFEIILKIMRDHRVLRWTSEEILSAYKLLPGGYGMNLVDAIPQKSQINIEVAAIIDGRLIQISNFFVLSYHKKNSKKRYVINLPQESVDNIEQYFVDNLHKNIYTLLYSKLKYDPLKAAKRMFSLSRYNTLAVGKNDGLAKKVLPLLTSTYALSGQIKSEISVMLVLLSEMKVNNFPYEVVRHQLDSYRGIISSFTDLQMSLRNKILEYINKIIHIMKNNVYSSDEEKALTIYLLEEINKILFNYSTRGAIKYLRSKRLIPLPKNLLPPKKDMIYN